MKTGVITFNVRERGRQWIGQKRNFDVVALARLINSPPVQERVKKRDLRGYLGHWVRERYGMEPPESVIDRGQVVPLEPALITVLLEADPDGTIRHQAEFLDTPTGRSAARMWSTRVGGFSSAVSLADRTDVDFPLGYHGFDYVREANYSTNRGYALDGVAATAGGVTREALDAVTSEHQGLIAALDSAYTQLQGEVAQQLAQATEALTQAVAERELLIGLLSKRPDAVSLRAALDGAHTFARPSRAAIGFDVGSFADEIELSKTIKLAGFAPMASPEDERESTMLAAAGRAVAAAAKVIRRGL